jgi:hypothetical protein
MEGCVPTLVICMKKLLCLTASRGRQMLCRLSENLVYGLPPKSGC